MVAWGSARTFDLDLLVGEEARKEVLARTTALELAVLFDAEGFTNLLNPDPELGRLTLLWLDGDTADRLFATAVQRTAPDGMQALVPGPMTYEEYFRFLKQFHWKEEQLGAMPLEDGPRFTFDD